MGWRDDAEHDLALILDNLAGPGWLYGFERHFWLDLWRAPVLEAADECGIEVRHYGPVRAFALAAEPRTSLFNLMLGVTAPGAAKGGYLAEALDWTESLGLDCRIPVRPDFGEPEIVKDLLVVRGYRHTANLAMYVRGGEPPAFPTPVGIEVEELDEEIEGFGDFFSASYEMDWMAETFFMGLPGRRGWRSYVATNESEGLIAAATTMMHHEVAQLGFAGTFESARRQGAHIALLHRRILDALTAGARELFAVTEEPLDYPEGASVGARNLFRAGFGLLGLREVWRPPERLVAPDEEEDDDEWDEGEWDEDDDLGPDKDHDFKLEV